MSTVASWALAIVIDPCEYNWRLLSILSAGTVVSAIPSFLIFDTVSCRDPSFCRLSSGAIALVFSAGTLLIIIIIFKYFWSVVMYVS